MLCWEDVVFLLVLTSHIIICPFTKVEESFNVQAIHDLLYHGLNVSNYDHLEFPGVVPRTFVGPMAVAALSKPAQLVVGTTGAPKAVVLLIARFCVALFVHLSFSSFLAAVRHKFGRTTSLFVLLITCSQFHLCFYASRPLPNVFALVLCLLVYSCLLQSQLAAAVIIATVSVVLFRCELVLLYAPMFVPLLYSRRLPLDAAVLTGIITAVAVLGVSVPIDSWFWRKWLWPEGQVWLFNVLENKSHQWGTQPFHWYFTSALPRSLLCSLPLALLGAVYDRRVRHLCTVATVFVILYSILPHKELRFIIYVVPLFNLCAAEMCSRFWHNRSKGIFHLVLALGVIAHLIVNMAATSVFLTASAYNYPGGHCMYYLHRLDPTQLAQRRHVHIDVFSAQTGVSRFLHENDNQWIYNKTEGLSLADKRMSDIDYLMVGSTTDLQNITRLLANYRTLFTCDGFDRVELTRLPEFPFIWPSVLHSPHVAVMSSIEE